MVVRYKQKCSRCKKNYIIVTWKQGYALCYDCQKREMEGKIEDPAMKALFNIPEEYYKENGFLRNIKITYLKYKNLTEKQIQAFRNTVEKIKEEKEHPPPAP